MLLALTQHQIGGLIGVGIAGGLFLLLAIADAWYTFRG